MDPTWQWCERVKENDRLKLKCSFCGNTISGGISRMKHHLAGTSKNVFPCVGGPNKPLPPFVRQQCLRHSLRQKRIQKEIEEADVGYNEPLEDEEEEEEAYEYDDEDDISLRTDLETARGRDRRGKGIIELEKESARKHTSQFDPISLEDFDDLEPWIEEEPATIFDDEDIECFNLEAEAIEGFLDEGESAAAGAEYVGEDLPILDEEDEEDDEDEDDEDYE
ncbi:hypothetical protein EJ110_NYTH26476 [Nymphaea thermarum]|nr:hypothetical protein EJ110_NYTH26476 [Nymphaea thermarum]